MSIQTKPKIYLSIDLEAVNNVDIVGIGMAVVSVDDKCNFSVLFKQEWWINPKNYKIDERCKRDFWDKNPKVWEHMMTHGKDEEEQIINFVTTYDTIPHVLHQMQGIDINSINLVSDNPEFDFGRLSPLIKKYCNREPLRYTEDGKYRRITDYGDAAWILGITDEIKEKANKISIHDHFPSNDAVHTIAFTVYAERYLCNQMVHL